MSDYEIQIHTTGNDKWLPSKYAEWLISNQGKPNSEQEWMELLQETRLYNPSAKYRLIKFTTSVVAVAEAPEEATITITLYKRANARSAFHEVKVNGIDDDIYLHFTPKEWDAIRNVS